MSKETRPTFRLIKEEVTEEETPFVSGRRIVILVVAIASFIWRTIKPEAGVFPGIEVSLTDLYLPWWWLLFGVGTVLLAIDAVYYFSLKKGRIAWVGPASDLAYILLTIVQVFFGQPEPM